MTRVSETMSISPILPPNPDERDAGDLLRARESVVHPREMGVREDTASSEPQLWAGTRRPSETRRISLIGWGLGAVVSLGLWAAILYLIR